MATAISPIPNWQFKHSEKEQFVLKCGDCFYSVQFGFNGWPIMEKVKDFQKNSVVYDIKGGEFFFISNQRKRSSYFVDLICFRPVIIFLPYIKDEGILEAFFKTKNNFSSRHIFYLDLMKWFGG